MTEGTSRRTSVAGSLTAIAGTVALLMGSVSPAVAHDVAADINTVMTPALHAKLEERIEAFRTEYNIVGMSVAVVTRDPATGGPETTTFAVGEREIGSTPVDASTQFEIASQTKAFTADLLAYLVAQGAVKLDDKVQKYAPANIVVPKWKDPDTGEETEITLRDLATHQAALIDQPANFFDPCAGIENCNPHPLYTQTLMWQALADSSLPWKPGTNWLYSNFGFGLLGTILANVIAPTSGDEKPQYQAALEGAFLQDLGMSETVLGIGSNMAAPYGTNENHENIPSYYWDDTNAVAGEGGLVSNATNMAIWDRAHLRDIPADAPLGVRTMADTLQPQTTITTICQELALDTCSPTTDFQMGLAWQLYPASVDDMGEDWAFKNGGTAGFSSDTVLAPSKGVAVTTMWNQERPTLANGQENDLEPGIGLLSLILHYKTLPSSGLDESSVMVPAVAAVALIAIGLFMVIRRRRDASGERP